MSNIFKIYDGRTGFWQWDTKQKLIVLDETVTEVHFSNRDINHAIPRKVYVQDGMRLCNIPDILLQLPRNLIAYAYANGATVKSVKYAVMKRPIPDGYVADQTEEIDEILQRLEMLEEALKQGSQGIKKFDDMVEAAIWAKENAQAGIIIIVKIDGKWIAHVVEDDYSVTPICNCDGQMVEVNIFDGGDGDGHEDITEVQYWDGGGAAGY